MAAEIAGGVGNAVAVARRDEAAREAKMRDLKAVQKLIDEVCYYSFHL